MARISFSSLSRPATTTCTSSWCYSSFYVVFPYIYRFIRRHPLSHMPVLVGSILWQFFYPYVVRHGWFGFVISGKLETRLVFSYPLYLLGGVVAALYLEQFHDWVLRFKVQILCATVLFAALPVLLDYFYQHGHHIPKIIAPGADPFAGAVIPYDVGAIIAVYLLGVYLVSPKRSAITRAITASGSEAAYGIYLSQIVWLIFLHRWFLEWGVLRHVPWARDDHLRGVLRLFGGFPLQRTGRAHAAGSWRRWTRTSSVETR